MHFERDWKTDCRYAKGAA